MMKSLLFIAALFLGILTSCKHESNLSELEQRKKELESKKQELQDKKAIAALDEELKSVDAEMKTLNKNNPPVQTAYQAPVSGKIAGTNVVMRAANSVQSARLSNFIKGETVFVLNKTNISPDNEAVANKDIALYKSPGNGEFTYTLPKGKAVILDSYHENDATYSVHYQHPDLGKLYAIVPGSALDHLSDEMWYFVRRAAGDEGWVTGKFLALN